VVIMFVHIQENRGARFGKVHFILLFMHYFFSMGVLLEKCMKLWKMGNAAKCVGRQIFIEKSS